MQVIILSGQAKSGKSLVASIIAEKVFEHGYIPVIENFAAPIKEEAVKAGLDKEKDHDSFRHFCQDFGRMKRTEDPDYFIMSAAERLAKISKEEVEDINNGRTHWERVVIFDDCRYPNECKFGKAMDAVLMFVTRGPHLPEPKAQWRDHESEHMSKIVDSAEFETHFDEVFDVYILNTQTKKDIERLISNQLDNWLGVGPALDCESDECDCPMCQAKRRGEVPDPAEILDYILKKLTGQDLSPDQLKDLENRIDRGGKPSIDIDFMISFEDEDDDDEEE